MGSIFQLGPWWRVLPPRQTVGGGMEPAAILSGPASCRVLQVVPQWIVLAHCFSRVRRVSTSNYSLRGCAANFDLSGALFVISFALIHWHHDSFVSSVETTPATRTRTSDSDQPANSELNLRQPEAAVRDNQKQSPSTDTGISRFIFNVIVEFKSSRVVA